MCYTCLRECDIPICLGSAYSSILRTSVKHFRSKSANVWDISGCGGGIKSWSVIASLDSARNWPVDQIQNKQPFPFRYQIACSFHCVVWMFTYLHSYDESSIQTSVLRCYMPKSLQVRHIYHTNYTTWEFKSFGFVWVPYAFSQPVLATVILWISYNATRSPSALGLSSWR